MSAASLWVASVASCTWTPEARPIEPRLVAEGPLYVVDHEEVRGKDYVLVVDDYLERLQAVLDADAEQYPDAAPVDVSTLSPTAIGDMMGRLQRNILDVGSGESCRIPGYLWGYYYRRDDRAGLRIDDWRAAYRRYEDGVATLEFVDVTCKRRGPKLRTWSAPSTVFDPSIERNVAVVRDDGTALYWVNPWKNDKRVISDQVLAWDYLSTPIGDRDDDVNLLLLEGDPPATSEDGVPLEPTRGELVVRRLDGEELARFGTDVGRNFVQTSFGGLRVAWESDGGIYEAIERDGLEPVRLTSAGSDACSPRYTSGKLEFFYPCATGRITRLDLATGARERLNDDVADEWTERGWSFELRYVGEADPETGVRATALWARPPGQAFTEVETPLRGFRPIDAMTLLGVSAPGSGYGDAGLWTASTGFTPVLKRVGFYYTFEDTRYTADRDEPVYLWAIHHGIEDGVGDLSLLSSRDLEAETIAEGVPVGGFRQYLFAAVLDPALVLVRDLTPTGGTLEATLIPDLLGTRIDDDVIGFTSRSSHQEPGLYYSVGPGEREGIWFAPL